MSSTNQRKISLTRILILVAIGFLFLGLVLPGIKRASHYPTKAAVKGDESQLVEAINAFYTDYGYYPCEKNTNGDENDYFTNGGPSQAKLMSILRAESNDASAKKYNPKGQIYLDVPNVKDVNHPRSGIGTNGVWYDPWGHPYLVKMDSNYNGIILNPYSANAGDLKLKAGVIVWSLGPDGKGATTATGNGDKNTGDNNENVISWQ